MRILFSLSLLLFLPTLSVFADGCLPGDPCYTGPAVQAVPTEEPKPQWEVQPIEDTAPVRMRQKPQKRACDGWGSRFSAGAPVYIFDKESTEVGGGIYYDLYSKCWPFNFRVGGEVTHMDANQSDALVAAEAPGRDAELTFVRVPLTFEWMEEVHDNTLLFLGVGPDIINTANDISDTAVGMHLSARLLYEFDENWGAAVEGGYMWGKIENDQGRDVELDNVFIVPTISYAF